jgi:hypothetical protein
MIWTKQCISSTYKDCSGNGIVNLTEKVSKLSTIIPQLSGSLNSTQQFSNQQRLANPQIVGAAVLDSVLHSIHVVLGGSGLESVQMHREIVVLAQEI